MTHNACCIFSIEGPSSSRIFCLQCGAQYACEPYDDLLSAHAHEESPEILLALYCTRSRTSNRQAPQRASRAAGALMTASLSFQTTTVHLRRDRNVNNVVLVAQG